MWKKKTTFEKRYEEALNRQKAAFDNSRKKMNEEQRKELSASVDEVQDAESQLALSKGEECAVLFDLGVKWDTGAPLPLLIKDEYTTYLSFYMRSFDPNWDGTYVNIIDPAVTISPIAVIEFERCISAKFGSPNEDVIHGHRLGGKGLYSYESYYVMNSRWMAEIEATNAIHPNFRSDNSNQHKHYFFTFHDSCFECIAKSHTIHRLNCKMSDVFGWVEKRISTRYSDDLS